MTDFMWDFFIAHAGPDKAAAECLYSMLATDSRVFLDSRSLRLGDDWDRAISRAQRSSRITVVLVSSRTDAAYYQREEIAAAIAMARKTDAEHRVVPVFLDAASKQNPELPYGIRLKHGITMNSSDDLPRVADQLRALLGQPTTTTSPATASSPSYLAPSRPHDTAAIRRLLTAALSDEELVALCMDHFLSVFEQFSVAMSKSERIQRLIEHCTRRRELARLLALVEQMNPAAFAAYEGNVD